MTEVQVNKIKSFIASQGLTFEPLKHEMLDHLIMDISYRINNGESFDTAWQAVSSQMTTNHFISLEKETMEAIKKQSVLTQRTTYLALALLLLTAVFKLMHFPGTTILLMSTIGMMSLSLCIGTVTGIRQYRDKKGANLMFMTLVAIIMHIIAWGFLILQLPGATTIRIASIIALSVTFSITTWQFHSKEGFENSTLSYLHETYAPGIERLLLIVLAMGGILKLIAISSGYPPNVGTALLIFVISGGVLHYYASNWQPTTSKLLTVALISTFIIGMLPALGPIIPITARTLLAASFYLSIGWIACSRLPSSAGQKIVVSFISLFYLIWAGVNLDMVSESVNALLFNIPVLLGLSGCLALCWNHKLLRIFAMTVIAHFLFEYPVALGLGL